ncbi:hypothetical protein FLJC2902T_31030 [Flavobacterium limnosediminis JC2902]|uniref:Uncharacterized protein n=1 Tax=Flavobacterium limnosediminis JC2902 TaxID=1341181 RepID=V6SLM4_9FLAO|nr:hypothetical protein FLJC2902T_31030 [Flavobacterium limnosediminis JC2902]
MENEQYCQQEFHHYNLRQKRIYFSQNLQFSKISFEKSILIPFKIP